MPRLTATEAKPTEKIRVLFSESLDLLNAMYFTHFALEYEGVEGWPIEVRREMAPDFLEEFDAINEYPAGDPGLVAILNEIVFARPETWRSVDALVRFVRSMPDGEGTSEIDPGIQGLIYQAIFKYPDPAQTAQYMEMPHREAIKARIQDLGDRDAEAIMALYDRPGELRERMARVIERFYAEHYKAELPNRRAALERSAAAHQQMTEAEAPDLIRRVSGRSDVCFENGVCGGPFEQLLFVPSIDMGPYMSCMVVNTPRRIHAMYYPCEPRFFSDVSEDADQTVQMARIHKALSDEQRLRILGILQEREMYSQEIVERTGLHQSVVSRHLSFLKAVGLVKARKEANMKYFSINTEIRDRLNSTLELFAPRARN
jgi:DNA-binding transcriptional ArsR family regulator